MDEFKMLLTLSGAFVVYRSVTTKDLENIYDYVMMVWKRRCNMPQIRPITDLRNTNEISEICHTKREPVFITKNGYGDLVVMSIELYEELMETKCIDKAIQEAEQEFAEGGVLLDAKEVLADLRRKYIG